MDVEAGVGCGDGTPEWLIRCSGLPVGLSVRAETTPVVSKSV